MKIVPALILMSSGWLFAASASAAPASNAAAPQALNHAAALYYQGRFDSAATRLADLLAGGDWKRRDSLVLYQYLGMASARLGRDSAAVGYFGSLLAVDSLFRIPRNEDSAVLSAFGRAREARAARSAPAVTSPLPRPAAGPDTASHAAAEAGAGKSDSGRGSPVTLALPGAAPAPLAVPSPALPPSARGPLASPEPRMNIGYGAIPFGGGWLLRSRVMRGSAIGLLEIAGLAFSAYASERQSRYRNGPYGLQNHDQLASAQAWQWLQRLSLSMTLGTYAFSIFASAED